MNKRILTNKRICVEKSRNSKHTSGDTKEEDQVIRRYHVAHVENIRRHFHRKAKSSGNICVAANANFITND